MRFDSTTMASRCLFLAAWVSASSACSESRSAVENGIAASDGPPASGEHRTIEARPGGEEARAADRPEAGNLCPPLMVAVDKSFCIDQYEAALEEKSASGNWTAASPYLTIGTRTVRAVPARDIAPQGYISGAEAAMACAAAGKRLCSSTEWLAACRGPAQTTWPYGNVHQDGACNDAYSASPVVKYFGTSEGVWDTQHMNDPGINQQPSTVAKGGSYSKCVSAWGAYDLHGNLHEWVDDPAGSFRGGFYADGSLNGPGCLYVTTAHAFSYHDYSTGFRCCAGFSK